MLQKLHGRETYVHSCRHMYRTSCGGGYRLGCRSGDRWTALNMSNHRQALGIPGAVVGVQYGIVFLVRS